MHGIHKQKECCLSFIAQILSSQYQSWSCDEWIFPETSTQHQSQIYSTLPLSIRPMWDCRSSFWRYLESPRYTSVGCTVRVEHTRVASTASNAPANKSNPFATTSSRLLSIKLGLFTSRSLKNELVLEISNKRTLKSCGSMVQIGRNGGPGDTSASGTWWQR